MTVNTNYLKSRGKVPFLSNLINPGQHPKISCSFRQAETVFINIFRFTKELEAAQYWNNHRYVYSPPKACLAIQMS